MNYQTDLFTPMLAAYDSGESMSNADLYERLASNQVLPAGALLERIAVGKSKTLHNPTRRKLRWAQQTAKALGLLEKVPGQRGMWRSTAKARGELTPAPHKTVLLGFSTKLGLALWGSCQDVFSRINEPVHCVLTSPPYCLSRPRAYGGPSETEYVDFICSALEPLIKLLVPGGTVTLNISNDVFLKGVPARSMAKERLVLALHDRFSLFKVDELIWSNASKAPGPIAWASKERYLLNTGYEPILVFANDPSRMFTSNQRVLQPHSDRQLKLIAKGGEQRTASFGDGANRLKPGDFSNPTAGKIPKNVLSFGHRCHSQKGVRDFAAREGLPVHGATFPLALAKFLVEYLTEPEQMVAEPFAGWFTGPLAAELTGRRWLASEKMLQYVEGGRYRFKACEGFSAEHRLSA
jgi:site-specific DNA-methyltransferase (cytosine-N4-specific)